jgi:hypothetical protein
MSGRSVSNHPLTGGVMSAAPGSFRATNVVRLVCTTVSHIQALLSSTREPRQASISQLQTGLILILGQILNGRT